MKDIEELSLECYDMLLRDLRQVLYTLARESMVIGQSIVPIITTKPGEMPLFLQQLIDDTVSEKDLLLIEIIKFNLR